MSLSKKWIWPALILLTLIAWPIVTYQDTSVVLVSVIGFSLLTIWLCSMLSQNISDEDRWVLLILAAGFLLKLLYIIYTNVGIRQHDVHSFAEDVNGHAGYIKYLLANGHLPDFDPREQFQFYHPPVHHIISALWVKLNLALGVSQPVCWENIQILTLFYSSACMILMYQLLKELGFHGKALLMSLTLFCFHPYFMFLAGSVNNDTLSVLFMMLTMLYTLRWAKNPSFKNIIILALAIGLGMSTKLSVSYLAPATALVFLYKLLTTKDWVKTLLPQFVVFAIVCIPLGVWWHIRCLVLFGLPLGYVPAITKDTSQYLGNTYSVWQRFFDLSWEQFEYLYISFGGEGTTYADHNILLTLLKSAVFEEQTLTRYNPLVKPASYVLFFSNLVLVGYSLWGMIRSGKRFDFTQKLTLYVTYVIVFVSFIAFCFGYPHVCTQSYRYITPTLFVGIAGLANLWESGKKTRVLDCALIVFCIASTAQFLLLGL